jgi:hypothetical protein
MKHSLIFINQYITKIEFCLADSNKTISKNCLTGDLWNIDSIETTNALTLLFVNLTATFL